jgi:hypothetical protein
VAQVEDSISFPEHLKQIASTSVAAGSIHQRWLTIPANDLNGLQKLTLEDPHNHKQKPSWA